MNLPDIIAAIRAAEAKATPGPWTSKLLGNGQTAIRTGEETLATVWTPRKEGGGNDYATLQGNRELIERARNHILALCDAAEAWSYVQPMITAGLGVKESAIDVIKAVEKIIADRDGYLRNADALVSGCGACMEVVCCGSTMHEHKGCAIAERDALLAEVKHLKSANAELKATEAQENTIMERDTLRAEVEALKSALRDEQDEVTKLVVEVAALKERCIDNYDAGFAVGRKAAS